MKHNCSQRTSQNPQLPGYRLAYPIGYRLDDYTDNSSFAGLVSLRKIVERSEVGKVRKSESPKVIAGLLFHCRDPCTSLSVSWREGGDQSSDGRLLKRTAVLTTTPDRGVFFTARTQGMKGTDRKFESRKRYPCASLRSLRLCSECFKKSE
jgi:hypothetical protein